MKSIVLFLNKRLWQKKGLLLFLIGTPLLLLFIQLGLPKESAQYEVGVYAEGEDSWGQTFLQLLIEQKEDVVFIPYESIQMLEEDVQTSKLDCGYILQDDLQERVVKGQWKGQIIVYQSPTFLMLPLVNEVFSRYFFEYCSSQWYEGYIAQHELFNEVDQEQLKNTLTSILESEQMKGETFQLEVFIGDEKVEKEAKETVVPLRGMLVIYLFLVGVLGTLDVVKDRKNVAFCLLKYTKIVQIYDIVMPVTLSAISTLVCLILGGQYRGFIDVLQMLVYVCIVCLWCFLLSIIITKEKYILMILPLLFLISIVLTPVMIDLGSIYSIIGILQKCFPMYYYFIFG